MANEYETLVNLKLAMGITDAVDDVLLQKALTTASRGIDDKCGFPARRFYLDVAASARVYTPRGRIVATDDGEMFDVDDIGSLTGLVVETGSGTTFTTVAATDYETQPDNAIATGRPITALLRASGAWGGTTGSRVRVTAKWGWPAIPDEVIQATLIQAERLFKRKDSPEGVLGSAEWGAVTNLARVDPDVAELLSRGGLIRRPRGFA